MTKGRHCVASQFSKGVFTTLIFFTIHCLLLPGLHAQSPMQAGFGMLEKGEFQQAKVFFAEYLEKDPGNPTALVCYGRATGLSGNVQEAQEVFQGLLEKDPANEEFLLNMAESHLWGGDGSSAAAVYKGILANNDQNFVALMGYANSMSAQKNYAEAYDYIQRALRVNPGNEQALISQKYIRLGLANYLAAQEGDYEKAKSIVDLNLQSNAEDQESLMLKATIHLLEGEFKNARNIYQHKIKKPLDAYVGWSVAEHFLGQDEKALMVVEEGLLEVSQNGDPQELLKMKLQYVTVLLWNNRLKEADEYVKQVSKENPDNKEVLASQAEVLIYLSDYAKGVQKYQQFLGRDSSSFKGNLGMADAHHALGLDDLAYEGAFKTLVYFPGQKDVLGFIERLNNSHAPAASLEGYLSETSDGSWRRRLTAEGSLGINALLKVWMGATHEIFGDALGEGEAETRSFKLGGSYVLNQKIGVKAVVDVASSNSPNIDFNYVNYDFQLSYRVNKNQQLVFSHMRELQNFNKALLERNIMMDHFIIKNIAFWKLPKIGWYSEYYYSNFSDGNSRSLLFTSVYRNLLDKPLLKTGINYSTMSFSETKAEQYYSPSIFHNFEWFAGFKKDETKKFKLGISADAAIGYQLSDGQGQPAWRTSFEVRKKLNRWLIRLHGQYSSISAVSNNGFSFSGIGLTIRYQLGEKPVFYERYKKKYSR